MSYRPKFPAWLLRPSTAAAGFCAGLILLGWMGRRVAAEGWHRDFVRFHPMVSPEAQYEPTVAEMSAIVRTACRPDQILVVVGGNSIFLGVGQVPDEVWTKRLQADLGDRYAVVNLAFRGASPSDGGAVVAEALRKEFPRQIYIANMAPFQSADPLGIDTYRFILLDAYYKGLLLPLPKRDREIGYYSRTLNYLDFPEMEKQAGARIDSWLYFKNLWTWYSYTHHFTFAVPLMPHGPGAYEPRGSFPDAEIDFRSIPFERRFSPDTMRADLRIATDYTAKCYRRLPGGTWVLNKFLYNLFVKDWRNLFPDSLKGRTLLAVSRNSPLYTRQLSKEILARDEDAIAGTESALKALGYDCIDYGRDFSDDDFGDRTHLTSTGGDKLADLVAPEVQALAARLGYTGRKQ
jgi:hypothetical protein